MKEKKLKCGNKCPYWHFSLRFPIGLGPICKKYNLPQFEARDKCFAVAGPGRGMKKNKEVKEIAKPVQLPEQPPPEQRQKKKPKQTLAIAWPGVNRGWGPITKQGDL
jgi:hypothetical protein